MLPRPPFLYPIIDADFRPSIVEDSLEALRAGAKIVQVRAKRLPTSVLVDAIDRLSPAFLEKNALLIVNDSVDAAMITDASGVHVGQLDLPPVVCRILLPKKVIGFSTHNMGQVAVADEFPVDYIAIGPIYRTVTKANADPPVGLSLLQKVRERTRRPLVAVGGIQSDNFSDLLAFGIDGIALISEIYRDGTMYDRVSRLLQLLDDLGARQHPE